MASGDANAFKYRLLQLSNALDADQLNKMKYLCGFIGSRTLEKMNTGCDLFDVLMQRTKLSAEDTNFLADLLTKVGRPDLLDILNYGAASAQSEPSEAQRGRLCFICVFYLPIPRFRC